MKDVWIGLLLIVVIALGTLLYRVYQDKGDLIEAARNWQQINQQNIDRSDWFERRWIASRCWHIAVDENRTIEEMADVDANPFLSASENRSCSELMSLSPITETPPPEKNRSIPTNYMKDWCDTTKAYPKC
jgi:hypothetical protein